MTTPHQKRLAILKSKGKSSVQQSAISSDPQPLVVELKKQGADKTVWDWFQFGVQLLGALAIPLVVLYISINFSKLQDASNQQQHQTDLQIAGDQQQEAALQGYLDHMSDLLLNNHLSESKPGDEVRQVARARTLTVLRRLTPERKGVLLRFLYDANLINVNHVIVDLAQADLSEVDLRGKDFASNLSGASLRETNLRGAKITFIDLSRADLTNADLAQADLKMVNLADTNLSGANLKMAQILARSMVRANLSGANLSGVNLSGVNLSGADLSGADLSAACFEPPDPCSDIYRTNLSGATLTGADLSGANLSGALVTTEQLKETKSLQGATMPDGSKHS